MSLPTINGNDKTEILPLSPNSPTDSSSINGAAENLSTLATSAVAAISNSTITEKSAQKSEEYVSSSENSEGTGTAIVMNIETKNNAITATEKQLEEKCKQEENQSDYTSSSTKDKSIKQEDINTISDNENSNTQLNEESTSETGLKSNNDDNTSLVEAENKIIDEVQQKPDAIKNESDKDKNIEWLTHFSMPRIKDAKGSTDGNDPDDVSADGSNKTSSSLKMLKKGAVAVAGGTMVGVGLVMIPLPTPFGAVVASSGLAVLGTEFEEAKELNDRLIDGAKGHLSTARDKIVVGIENMNSEHDEDEEDELYNETEKNEGASGTVIKVKSASVAKTTNATNEDGVDSGHNNTSDKTQAESSDNKNNDGDGTKTIDTTDEAAPVWLHMNPIERERQIKLARIKYRRENQTTLQQAKEAFTKRTGRFLSRNLLPYIKKKEERPPAEETVEFMAQPPTSTAERDDSNSPRGISDTPPVPNQDPTEPPLLSHPQQLDVKDQPVAPPTGTIATEGR
mmetsp:Transcript_19086/g.44178  ORF Transcript_19086/g.44178 Transcript_19086/m.44178 type:complete len:511 (+) Transcript_19086:207-1739(+)